MYDKNNYDYTKKPDALWAKVEGVYELTYVSEPKSGQSGSFVPMFGAVYFIDKNDKKGGYSTINMTADDELVDTVKRLQLKKGDRIHITGTLGQRKETRFKSDKGEDIYTATIRLTSIALANVEQSEQPRETPKPKPQSNNTPTLPEIADDDLPF